MIWSHVFVLVMSCVGVRDVAQRLFSNHLYSEVVVGVAFIMAKAFENVAEIWLSRMFKKLLFISCCSCPHPSRGNQ